MQFSPARPHSTTGFRLSALSVAWLILLCWLGNFNAFTSHAMADELQSFPNCTLVKTQWSDGDSFLIKLEDGKEFTVRLYGVDCIEYHVGDTTDARRLRSQRRYFGISSHGGNAQASIKAAKGFGGEAKTFVAQTLAQPFTVTTAFSDARGDGKYKRYYAFITTHNGEDLAEQLVRAGLARAFGVYRQTPDGKTRNEQREQLSDLEFLAAQKRNGVWAITNWDDLPAERRLEREQEAELKLATDNQPLTPEQKIDLNTAARDELMRLPGVGEVLANRIIENRPYQTITDIQTVQGIGAVTLQRMLPNLTLEQAN